MFNEEEKAKIAKTILERLKEYKCPMCGSNKFSIVEEYGLQFISTFGKDGVAKDNIGTPYIMMICGNCGFMSKHNMFALGLMDNELIAGMSNLRKP